MEQGQQQMVRSNPKLVETSRQLDYTIYGSYEYGLVRGKVDRYTRSIFAYHQRRVCSH